jgi:ketosteroid isomerase-like protein
MPHRTTRLALLVGAVLPLLACSHRIPGTEIQDNDDTRAIVDVIDKYRQAAERRDADTVLSLVSKRYFDDAGTPDPSDDVDYDQLRKRLTTDYARLTAVRLEIGVRKIEIAGEKAQAFVFYDEHYRIATKAGEVSKQANDVQRMRFVREDGAWKFSSGI